MLCLSTECDRLLDLCPLEERGSLPPPQVCDELMSTLFFFNRLSSHLQDCYFKELRVFLVEELGRQETRLVEELDRLREARDRNKRRTIRKQLKRVRDEISSREDVT